MRRSIAMTAGSLGILAAGMGSGDPNFLSMMGTLALSGLVGYGAVWNVAPSLHSPLMAVTNAISGMTAVGGLSLMGGGLVPTNAAEALGAASVLVSTVNIAGGSLCTVRLSAYIRPPALTRPPFRPQMRMLDMFKRKGDAPENNALYLVPGAAMLGGYVAAHAAGFPGATQMTLLASSLFCIGGIAGLSSQSTARMGNAMGMIGIGGGARPPLLLTT